MIDSYITVACGASSEISVQKSRFIGYVCPCITEEDAQEYIRSIREKHRDARHHCYAYIIGENNGIMRYSDDGEPGGTAGMPIIDVLKKGKIVNCCVVVVRYFGGILLGTGGLVRAYTQSCKDAISAAGLVCMELSDCLRCRVTYQVWNQMQYLFLKKGFRLEEITYQDMIDFTVCARKRDTAAVTESIVNISEGKAEWLASEEKYIPWSI